MPPDVVRLLLDGVAPERKIETSEFLARHQPVFRFSKEAQRLGGFCALINKNHVLIAPRAREALWLLSFAAWRGFRARVPQEFLAWLLSGENRDAVLTSEDDGYEAEVTVSRGLAKRAMEMLRGAFADASNWPSEVPTPAAILEAQDLNDGTLPLAHWFVKDLALFALAYVFLHELRHIAFNSEGREKISNSEEELACDEFAVDQILGNVAASLAAGSPDLEKLIFRRSMGLMVGFFALHAFTAEGQRGETRNYPSLVRRLDAIITRISLHDDHDFWIFGSSLLRELHGDSDYAVLEVDSTKTRKENFMLLARREFR